MSTRFSGGGGVVAEIFRDLQNPMRISGGGGSGRNLSGTQIACAIRWGGGSSAEVLFSVTSEGHFPLMGPFFSFLLSRRGAPGAEFFFSVASKRHFRLMGPFFSFLLSRRGAPGAEFFFSVASKRHFPLMGPCFSFLLSRRGARAPWAPPLNRPLDCESLCLSDETLKAVGPFYLVSMPGDVKDPTQPQGVNV